MTRMLKPCLVLLLLCAAVVGSRAQATATVFINEFHYDNAATDTGEFVEIAGPAGTDLAGYSIVLYNGANGQAYTTTALSGSIPNQQNGYGVVTRTYPTDGIQNGSPDGIALMNGTTVIQFLSYEGSFTAITGPAAGSTGTDIGVTEVGTTPVGQSLQLSGTGTRYGDFTWTAPSTNTLGLVNTGQSFAGVATATIAIDNASVTEGNSGTTNVTFTVTVTGTHSDVTFDIATADGIGPDPATLANGDYTPRAENAVQISSASSSYVFTVPVNGDVTFEADEQFLVNLTNVVGADIADGQGVGTIVNDEEAPPVTSDVVISQVYGGGGNAGATFTHDFIELFNRGTTSVSLAGWSVQYSGATATTWTATALSGSIPPGGYYLVHESQGAGGTTPLPAADATGTIAMSATAGKIALRNSVTPFAGACPAVGTAGDLVGYGPTANCDEGAGPTAATSNTTAALRKRGGCFDSNNNNTDFSIASPTPRNSFSATKSCDFVPTDIHAIQGDGAFTPYAGVDVITTGIVTGRKSNGFFIQTSDDADGNPATSQGLFVFTGATPAVAVGDAVTARGTATEFFALTQIESSLPGDVTVDSSGNILPAAVTLTTAILDPAGAPDQLERYESMRMHADSLTSVAPTNEFGEIQTVLTGVARPMREEGIEISLPVPPDPTSGLVDCCIPRWDENPERIMIDSDGLAGASVIAVTSHVTLLDVTGPLDFAFGDYKVLPETPPATSGNISAIAVPLPAPGEFTIAGFNIENFANNDTQRRKAALAIRQVLHYPDVLGHVEIRDLVSLQALAAQVNADAVAAGDSDPAYEARLIEAPAGGTQNLGFLVKTARVHIDAVTQELGDETFGPQPAPPNVIYLHDRPPLVLRATVTLPGQAPRPVIVVVNHLRSFIDIDLVAGDGPRVRAKRTEQAESTARLLQSLQTDNPTTPVISIGDYNAYQFNDGYTDPIAILKGSPTPDNQIVEDESPDLVNPNYINLTDSLMPASERYSFVFEGTPQALDHVLVNTVGAALVQRYAIARNNADFPEGPLYAGDVTRPERNSDHDMPVAYFAFPSSADLSVTAVGPPSPVQTGGLFSYTVTVSNGGPDDASNVTLSIPAQAGLRFSALQTPAGATCTAPAPGTSGAISCVVPSIAAGGSETFVITAMVDCGVPDMTHISQAILVSSAASDPATANNSAAVAITAANPPPTIFGVITPVVVSPVPGAPQPGAVVSNATLGVPTVADNCGGATIVRSGVPAGNLFPVGTTTINYTATDSGGATATASATVKVLSAKESLQAIEAELQGILTASTQSALTKRVKSALASVRKAIQEVDGGHRGRVNAVVFISAALIELEDIENRRLLNAATVQSLLQRLTGVSWLLAAQQPGQSAVIRLGNAAAAGGHYSAASALYWLAMNLAR